ncbi:hypothetical protein PCANC_20858 [Puccinia coronata f. sp. avenae]|uniref:Uncharacterized protein n=1 Tax=Puccinia coronata f. sp. avenae TaxID=200324 RepID=A0A2N5S7S3_9BASI|nr:hypothetical protein PCANC_20858 [Puccinia coronata f. sp. avenae]
METPHSQPTPQQPQPPTPQRADLPAQAPPRMADKGTPSEASEDLAEVCDNPFELGEAIGVVSPSERGLQVMYVISRPDRPAGSGINEIHHPHVHHYRVGNELLGPPVDVFWDGMQMAYSWPNFENWAIDLITSQNPGAGFQVRANRGTAAVTWQAIIPHHPSYDRHANEMLVGEDSWRQFVVAIADAAHHGQNSQLWCVYDNRALVPSPAARARVRQARIHSPEIMFLIPAVPVVHLGNGRTPSPDIMVYIPSPTNERAQPAVALPQAQIIEITDGPNTPATGIPPAEVIVAPAHNATARTSDTLTMEQFLTLSWIDKDDANTRQLISRRMISHWTYFTLSTEQQLRDLGFEEGPARLLCLGAIRAQGRM